MISFFFFLEICVDPLKIPLRKKGQSGGSEFALHYYFFLDVSFQPCPPGLCYLAAFVCLLGSKLGKQLCCSYVICVHIDRFYSTGQQKNLGCVFWALTRMSFWVAPERQIIHLILGRRIGGRAFWLLRGWAASQGLCLHGGLACFVWEWPTGFGGNLSVPQKWFQFCLSRDK